MNHFVSKVALLFLLSSSHVFSKSWLDYFKLDYFNPFAKKEEKPHFIANPLADSFAENVSSYDTTTHYDNIRIDKQTCRIITQPTIAVMNYSVHKNLQDSLESLQRNNVSGHYVIDTNGDVVEVVDPEKRAYHAGISIFKPESAHPVTDVNSNSASIIFVNDGETAYTPAQTKAAILLLAYLQKEGKADLRHFVGHGEVAVDRDGNYGRKIGPGPLFPWKELAQAGYGLYPQISDEQKLQPITHFTSEENKILWMQHALNKYGYNCPITGIDDKETREILKQFQMHYRPTKFDGKIDDETLHVMNNVLKQVNEKTPSKKKLQPPCFE